MFRGVVTPFKGKENSSLGFGGYVHPLGFSPQEAQVAAAEAQAGHRARGGEEPSLLYGFRGGFVRQKGAT